jgi:hypothetical protein
MGFTPGSMLSFASGSAIKRRLFFSSLTAEDLELARQAILNERVARRKERRSLAVLARTKSRKTVSSESPR